MRSTANGGAFAVKGEATEYDFGLGLKMMMMANHRQSPKSESVDFSGDRDPPAPSGVHGRADFGAIFCSNSTDSWGGRVFTASQRQELERQTTIYKYMAASIPVPTELLLSMNSRYPSNEHGNGCGKSSLDVWYGKGSKDEEPWRCKRTDGKKWRCAKEKAPDQRYCEKHSHKGRPSRSRKHVESASTSSNSTRRISNKNTSNSSPNSSVISPADVNTEPQFLYQTSPAMFLPQNHLIPSQSQYSNPRSSDWFFKREADHAQSIAGLPTASPFFDLHQIAPTPNSPPTRTATSSDFMIANQTQSPLPRQFLDESYDSNLLTLTMADGGAHPCNEESDDVAAAQLGMGLFDSERDGDIDAHLSERYAWMGSLAPGGPLAEALCLGIIGADSAEGGAEGGYYDGHGEMGFMK